MNWKDGMNQSIQHMKDNDDEVYGMRFVHVIARLKESLEVVETKLDDLDDMAITILHGEAPYTSSEQAMVALIENCEVQVRKEAQRLGSRITGYEYRRDFGTS